MNLLQEWVATASGWLAGYLPELVNAVALTLLAIFGDDINRSVKRVVKDKNIAIRLTVFILLCTVGYGLLTTALVQVISRALAELGSFWLAPSTIALFIALGLIAERKKQI